MSRRRTAAVGLAIALAAACGSLVTGSLMRSSLHPVHAETRSSLAPDPAAIRYRFDPKASAPGLHDASTDAEMLALEAKIKAQPTAIDLAELAGLLLARAQTTGHRADYDRSAEVARQSLAILPDHNGAQLTLAKLANTRHEFREAITLTRQFLATGDSAGAYGILATAHLALGELTAACDAADIAVDGRPHTGAYLMRALVLQAQGRDAEAAGDFERAAAVEDFGDVEESARLRALWGRFLLRKGEYDGARRVLDEALRISPELPLALAQQGELALRQGQTQEAIALFDRAFGGGREIRYLIDRARAQELAKDVAGATATRNQIEILVRAELAESALGHRLDLVEVLVDRGAPADLVEAIALAREEVTRRPSADTHFQLARALARSGVHAEAALEMRRALATGIHDARMYELAARLERVVGNPKRAALYAREAVRFDPASRGWRGLGLIP